MLQMFQGIVADLMILANKSDLHILSTALLDDSLNSGPSADTEASAERPQAAITTLRKKLGSDFAVFSAEKQLYNQVRFLDSEGQESVRVNFESNSQNVTIVPDEQLQNKADRYYFKEALPLGPGEIFISPFDLNVEQGQVQDPPVPMLRFSTAVFDTNERKAGIVVLNFLGQTLLDEL